MMHRNKAILVETALMLVFAASFLTLSLNVVGHSLGYNTVPDWFFPASVLAGSAFLIVSWRLILRTTPKTNGDGGSTYYGR